TGLCEAAGPALANRGDGPAEPALRALRAELGGDGLDWPTSRNSRMEIAVTASGREGGLRPPVCAPPEGRSCQRREGVHRRWLWLREIQAPERPQAGRTRVESHLRGV